MGSGDYNSAEIYFKKAVDIAAPDDIESIRGLIVFYLNIYRCEDAEPLCIKYLQYNQLKFGETAVQSAQPLRFLGVLRHRQKRYAEAISILEKSYLAWSDAYGPVHPDVQRVTNDLVEALKDSNELDKAEQFAEQNYDNASRFSPETRHLSISDSASSYAQVLIAKNSDLTRAEELLRQAIDIREHVLGLDATRVAEVLLVLVELHISSRTVSAEDSESISRAYTNFSRAWGVDHPDSVKAYALKTQVEALLLPYSNV
jgi:tetratricopeptide (TPR) repeat protein